MEGVIQTRATIPPRIVIHGPEFVGKSTFASQAPNPIFIQTEDGLAGIDATAFPLCTSYDEVIHYLGRLGTEPHSFTTAIVDSGDWLERIIHAKVCADEKVATVALAGGGFGKGYELAQNYFKNILSWLDYLRMARGMTVILICHSYVVPYNDPLSEPFDRYELALHANKRGAGTRSMVTEWADVLGYAARQTVVAMKEDTTRAPDKDGKRPTVARGSVLNKMNKLFLTGTPAFAAGNRYNLPDSVDLTWEAFSGSFPTNKGTV